MAYLGAKCSFTRELFLIVFILSPLTLSNPIEHTLKDRFEEYKQQWLEHNCIFPGKNALGLEQLGVFDRPNEHFQLKVCSDNIETSNKKMLCDNFFQISNLLCSSNLTAVEKQSLDPAHLDTLIKARGTKELCAKIQARNLAQFAWLNEAQNGCSTCEDAELRPVCDLMFAAVVSYFQTHVQSSASGAASNGNTGPPAAVVTRAPNNEASRTQAYPASVTRAPNIEASGTQASPEASGQGTAPQAAAPKNMTAPSGPGDLAVTAAAAAAAAASTAQEGGGSTIGGIVAASGGGNPLGGGSSVSRGNVPVAGGDSHTNGESQPGNMMSVGRNPPGSMSHSENEAENQGNPTGGTGNQPDSMRPTSGSQPDSVGLENGAGNQPGSVGLENGAGNQPGSVGLENGAGNQPGSVGLENGAGNQPGSVGLENGAGNQPGSVGLENGAGNQPGSVGLENGAGNQPGSVGLENGAGNQPGSVRLENGAGNQPGSVGLENGAGVGLENGAGNQPENKMPGGNIGNGGENLAGGQPVVGTEITSTSTPSIEDEEEQSDEEEYDAPLDNEQNGQSQVGTDMGLKRPGLPKPPIPEDGVQSFNNVVEYNFKDEEAPSGHFMAYFITAIILCVAGYVIYHNKQKIYAIALEGRRDTSRRRSAGGSESSAKYSKLQSTVEDVVPALEKSTTSKNYIY